MPVRGIRGAVTVNQDQPGEILAAVRELLEAILSANPTLLSDDLASAVFSMTEDLSSEYPAKAARQMGWEQVPLFCTREIPVPGSLTRCVRVLLHWNTDLKQTGVHHVYLGGAAVLRPDLANASDRDKK